MPATPQNEHSPLFAETLSAVFGDAVTAARRDYPGETKSTAFIDLSAPDSKEQLARWLITTFKAHAPSYPDDELRSLVYKYLESDEHLKDTGFCRKLADVGTSMLGVRSVITSDFFRLNFPDPVKLLSITFNHELGHLVAENGVAPSRQRISGETNDKDRNEGEIAADIFMLLRCLQQRAISRKDVDDWSLFRAINAWRYDDAHHLTTIAIDKLVLSSADAAFMSLTPAETKAIAENHARLFRISDQEQERLRIIFRQALPRQGYFESDTGHTRRCLKKLAEICRAAPDDSVEFYVSARILRTALDDGKLVIPGQKKPVTVYVKGGYWDDLRCEITARARGTRAEKTLAPKLPAGA
jgi:hypothetical protein